MHTFRHDGRSASAAGSRTSGATLPLEGLLVVSCEQAVAAPFATRQLADLGARVIKIERPGSGDFARGYDETVQGLSSHFVWLNRSKESIALDLKNPTDLAVVQSLLEHADVYVQNLAPGAASRLGLGPQEARQKNPRLIACSITGYGTSGPMRNAKAYDLLIQAEAGLVSITGSEDEPAKSGIPAADIAAGMYAFSGILAALYDREHTGAGTALDISLFDSLVEWMGYPMYYATYGGAAPRRCGTSHAAIAPYGTFTAGDGTSLVLSVQNEREWRAFCADVLDAPELADDERFAGGSSRVRNRSELDRLIEERLGRLTGTQFEMRLQKSGIAHARLRNLHEVAEHPQLSSRDRWRTVETATGDIWATLPPIVLNGVEPRMDRIPTVGEHTDAIIDEFGLART